MFTYLRKPLGIAACMTLFHQLTGINILIFFSASLEKASQQQILQQENILYSLYLNFINSGATLLSLFFIENIGRRKLLGLGCLIIIVSHFISIFTSHEDNTFGNEQFIFMFGFGLGTGPVIWVYLSDILPACGCAVIVAVEQLPNIFFAYLSVETIQSDF